MVHDKIWVAKRVNRKDFTSVAGFGFLVRLPSSWQIILMESHKERFHRAFFFCAVGRDRYDLTNLINSMRLSPGMIPMTTPANSSVSTTMRKAIALSVALPASGVTFIYVTVIAV